MSPIRIIGILLLLCGIALVGGSYYIMDQVESGKIKINKAEQQVNQTNSIMSLSPYTKDIGEGISKSAGSKINEANATVADYTQKAQWAKMGGYALCILGIGMIIFGRKKHGHK